MSIRLNRFVVIAAFASMAASALPSCERRGSREVSMACRWVMYGEELDSFVFNLDRNEVYWVNEKARYPISELTEGRIGFSGKRSQLRVGEAQILRDVKIDFSINRVTGELYVSGGITPPNGYNNSCVVKDKIL